MPVLSVDDLNAETPVSALADDVVGVESFYVRSNFDVPELDPATWSLEIRGQVDDPYRIDFAELQALPIVRERVTLECAGNFRTLMEPVPSGTPWGIGAASVADFTGVRVSDLLLRARPHRDVVEWVFVGSDRGTVEAGGEAIHYAFPLESEVAHHGHALLVWEMNEAPLTAEHGAPVRLVVPGHYGMRSVKWVVAAEAVVEPFAGHFRTKYRYYGSSTEAEGAAVDRIRVRSIIASPTAGPVPPGVTTVTGAAWSGHGPITSVEVRVDDGDWVAATIEPGRGAHATSRWSTSVDLSPGSHRIAARATDTTGDVQPETPRWNRNGYGNNVVHTVIVTAEGR